MVAYYVADKIVSRFVYYAMGVFLWGDLDQDQWSKITRIMVYQRNWWMRDQSGFIGSFDATWSEWSWATDPDPDHPPKNAPYNRT